MVVVAVCAFVIYKVVMKVKGNRRFNIANKVNQQAPMLDADKDEEEKADVEKDVAQVEP